MKKTYFIYFYYIYTDTDDKFFLWCMFVSMYLYILFVSVCSSGVQERHGPVTVGPEEGRENGQRAGRALL